MEGTQHSITKTLKRFRSFRYSLILEGIAAGAAAGLVVVAFRLLQLAARRFVCTFKRA